ncbi:hypothetical protein [Cobetia sp. MC34]|uniref:hypothetical protein n=1 Tax=Cobetia sp. MC34 TaxID=2785080 RepID=UPI001BC9F604|nr:hypothetical protein [Cobetia sp. MC34]MBS4155390.1 hypothetical protein [Cobetia sp. MC34]
MAHHSNHKIYTDPREAALVKAADQLLCWPRHPRMNGLESTACPGWVWHSDENNEPCLVRLNDCSLKITESEWLEKRSLILEVMKIHRRRATREIGISPCPGKREDAKGKTAPVRANPLSRFHQAASNADDDYHKLATTLLQAFEQMAMGGEAQPAT